MPDNVLAWGIDLILSLQGWGEGLLGPMNFFTFLGREEFFLLLMPVLYWSVDSRVGLRIAIYLTTSSFLNGVVKVAFHAPRPYWFDTRVRLLGAPESSFGIPSGHAQNAVVIWGGLAAALRKGWGWVAAIALMFLIGFSRLYLGVHFPTDVLAGWVIGGVLFGLLIWLESPVVRWFRRFTLRGQIAILFGLSLAAILVAAGSIRAVEAVFALPAEWVQNAALAAPEEPIAPLSLSGTITTAAAFFGLVAGALWLERRGGFDVRGPLAARAGRFLVGLVGVLLFWMGLDVLFGLIAADESLLGYVLRFIRYSVVGAWITALAPLVFVRLKLSGHLLVRS